MRIAFLVSGSGTNMQAVLDAIGRGEINATPVLCISSNSKAYALERARLHGLHTQVCRLKDFDSIESRDAKILSILQQNNVELVVLAGFLGVLTPSVVNAYPRRIINIHPALLPKFGGKGFYGIRVHEAVLEAGEEVTGATAHFLDCGIDTGEIICQKSCKVEKDDTAQALAQRVLKQCEYSCLCNAIKMVTNNENIGEKR